jgi:hypothetical protein
MNCVDVSPYIYAMIGGNTTKVSSVSDEIETI